MAELDLETLRRLGADDALNSGDELVRRLDAYRLTLPDVLDALNEREGLRREVHWLGELAEGRDQLLAAYRIGIGGSRRAGTAIDRIRKAQEELRALAAREAEEVRRDG